MGGRLFYNNLYPRKGSCGKERQRISFSWWGVVDQGRSMICHLLPLTGIACDHLSVADIALPGRASWAGSTTGQGRLGAGLCPSSLLNPEGISRFLWRRASPAPSRASGAERLRCGTFSTRQPPVASRTTCLENSDPEIMKAQSTRNSVYKVFFSKYPVYSEPLIFSKKIQYSKPLGNPWSFWPQLSVKERLGEKYVKTEFFR